MPYRIDVPEGEEALEHILNHLGTTMLVESRKRMFRIVYDAPETTLSPREREVMRFPMTAMMGCPICNSMRLWRDWPGFSDEPIEEELYKNAEAIHLEWPRSKERRGGTECVRTQSYRCSPCHSKQQTQCNCRDIQTQLSLTVAQ